VNTRSLQGLNREKRQQPHNPCRTCEVLIGIAKRHFHNNFTDQGALKTQLDLECRNLAQHGFTDAEVQGCIALVDGNMPAIYNELVNNPTATPQKICTDLKQCMTVTTLSAVVTERTCEEQLILGASAREATNEWGVSYMRDHHQHRSPPLPQQRHQPGRAPGAAAQGVRPTI
jgi:hypothetical protein